MLAARVRTPGDPSVITVDDVPEPREPDGDEVLVAVEASSVNGTDLGLRRGAAPVLTLGRGPLVLGFDLAGRVLRCGPRVTAFRPGDRVVALLGHRGGGHAERVVLRQSRAALAPASVPAAHAAALPLAGLTALQALHAKAGLGVRPGARVLVVGASGGIGSYAVQLAKLAGAHVTAVASGQKLERVAALGADELVDRHRQDALALGQVWDVVLDAHGGLAFTGARGALADGGVFVSVRAVSGDLVRSLAPHRLRRRAPRRPPGPRAAVVMTRARSQDLAHLAALVDAGRLRPPVDRTFPLAQVADAHRWAEGPTSVGKVVVTMPDAGARDGA